MSCWWSHDLLFGSQFGQPSIQGDLTYYGGGGRDMQESAQVKELCLA